SAGAVSLRLDCTTRLELHFRGPGLTDFIGQSPHFCCFCTVNDGSNARSFVDLFRGLSSIVCYSPRRHNDDMPSKFIVLADSIKSAINIAWEHGGADFQSRFDKSTGQAQEMKEEALRVL